MQIKKYLYFLLLSTSLLSCGSKSLIPDLKFGQPETVWSKAAGVFTAIKPDHSWDMGKNKTLVTLFINIDGVSYFTEDSLHYGPLRLIVMDLKRTEGVDFSKNVYSYDSDTLVIDENVDAVCSIARFDTILKYLRDTYGKEDSLSYKTVGKGSVEEFLSGFDPGQAWLYRIGHDAERVRVLDSVRRIGGVDTLIWRYHFSTSESQIVIWRDAKVKGFDRIPFDHYEHAQVVEYANDYDKLKSDFIKESRGRVYPGKAISVPVDCGVTQDDYGNLRIRMTADIGDPIKVMFPQEKAIVSVMGKFILFNTYGDKLYETEDIDIRLAEPLQPKKDIGISQLLDVYERPSYIMTENLHTVYLDPFHRTAPRQLASEFKSKMKFRAEFVPRKILFEDGSVLKQKEIF